MSYYFGGNNSTLTLARIEAAGSAFCRRNDSTYYVDWSTAKRMSFPIRKPTTQEILLRLPLQMLERINVKTNARHVHCQSLIRIWLKE